MDFFPPKEYIQLAPVEWFPIHWHDDKVDTQVCAIDEMQACSLEHRTGRQFPICLHVFPKRENKLKIWENDITAEQSNAEWQTQ